MNKNSRVSNVLTPPIVFFCKDCEMIVDAKPLGRKFVYKCSRCSTKNVAFGTEKAIRDFYRVKEEPATVKPQDDAVKPAPEVEVSEKE